jgi:hypothetical protein
MAASAHYLANGQHPLALGVNASMVVDWIRNRITPLTKHLAEVLAPGRRDKKPER